MHASDLRGWPLSIAIYVAIGVGDTMRKAYEQLLTICRYTGNIWDIFPLLVTFRCSAARNGCAVCLAASGCRGLECLSTTFLIQMPCLCHLNYECDLSSTLHVCLTACNVLPTWCMLYIAGSFLKRIEPTYANKRRPVPAPASGWYKRKSIIHNRSKKSSLLAAARS